MTKQDIVNAVQTTLEELKTDKFIPYATGNMARNTVTSEITVDHIDVYINLNEAPYAPYTNEPWIAEKWKGATNTNAGWWERFVEEFAQRLANKLRGEIK